MTGERETRRLKRGRRKGRRRREQLKASSRIPDSQHPQHIADYVMALWGSCIGRTSKTLSIGAFSSPQNSCTTDTRTVYASVGHEVEFRLLLWPSDIHLYLRLHVHITSYLVAGARSTNYMVGTHTWEMMVQCGSACNHGACHSICDT